MFGTLGRMLGGMFGVGGDAVKRVGDATGFPVSATMPIGDRTPMQPGDGSMLRPQVQDPWSRSPGAPDYGVPPGGVGFKGGADPMAPSAETLRPMPGYGAPMGGMMPSAPAMGGLSTGRQPQTIGMLLWPGYGWGGSAPPRYANQAPSQLPMGRASATGSVPFMQTGNGWGGRI